MSREMRQTFCVCGTVPLEYADCVNKGEVCFPTRNRSSHSKFVRGASFESMSEERSLLGISKGGVGRINVSFEENL